MGLICQTLVASCQVEFQTFICSEGWGCGPVWDKKWFDPAVVATQLVWGEHHSQGTRLVAASAIWGGPTEAGLNSLLSIISYCTTISFLQHNIITHSHIQGTRADANRSIPTQSQSLHSYSASYWTRLKTGHSLSGRPCSTVVYQGYHSFLLTGVYLSQYTGTSYLQFCSSFNVSP